MTIDDIGVVTRINMITLAETKFCASGGLILRHCTSDLSTSTDKLLPISIILPNIHQRILYEKILRVHYINIRIVLSR